MASGSQHTKCKPKVFIITKDEKDGMFVTLI